MRKEYKMLPCVNYTRGIAAILVILQHCGICSKGLLSFHMAVFFFLSGYVMFHQDCHNLTLPQYKEYLIIRFKRLMIPYYLFETGSFLLTILFKYIFEFFGYTAQYKINIYYAIRDILLCLDEPNYISITNRFWFLPCLFCAEALFYIIRKLFIITRIRNKKVFLIILITLCLALFIQKKYFILRWPFELDTSIYALIFLITGYCLYDIINKLSHNIKVISMISFVCLTFLIITTIFNTQPVYVYRHTYGIVFFAELSGLFGSLFLFGIVTIMQDYLNQKIILWFNKYSLILYPLQLQVLVPMALILKYIGFNSSYWYYPYLKLILTIIILYITITLYTKISERLKNFNIS